MSEIFSGVYGTDKFLFLFAQILLLHHADSMWYWGREGNPGEGGMAVMDRAQRGKSMNSNVHIRHSFSQSTCSWHSLNMFNYKYLDIELLEDKSCSVEFTPAHTGRGSYDPWKWFGKLIPAWIFFNCLVYFPLFICVCVCSYCLCNHSLCVFIPNNFWNQWALPTNYKRDEGFPNQSGFSLFLKNRQPGSWESTKQKEEQRLPASVRHERGQTETHTDIHTNRCLFQCPKCWKTLTLSLCQRIQRAGTNPGNEAALIPLELNHWSPEEFALLRLQQRSQMNARSRTAAATSIFLPTFPSATPHAICLLCPRCKHCFT